MSTQKLKDLCIIIGSFENCVIHWFLESITANTQKVGKIQKLKFL